ncbi:hypothetical protein [Streptomyces sioyaensis]|uniref:hypothetical protein n=1 Tax=Streptomyces sioyaensis TaxID=67364 RepID=UPI0037A83FCB
MVFSVLSHIGWQWGALAAFLLGALLVVRARRAGAAGDALILETSALVFFALLTCVAFASPHAGLAHYVSALAPSWLALTAWATLAVRRPFTLGIARQNAPREFWSTPQFLRINTVITTAWATSFTLTAAAVAACIASGAWAVVQIACQAAGFLAPVVFTGYYVKAVQARLAALAGTS